MTIHFGSFDDRFCGSRVQGRRFTVDPNDVTCERCRARDTFVLSATGQAIVAAIDALPVSRFQRFLTPDEIRAVTQ